MVQKRKFTRRSGKAKRGRKQSPVRARVQNRNHSTRQLVPLALRRRIAELATAKKIAVVDNIRVMPLSEALRRVHDEYELAQVPALDTSKDGVSVPGVTTT